MQIAVVAPSNPLPPEIPGLISALAKAKFGERAPDIHFHPQCFERDGHFAGSDAMRREAMIEVANDPDVDAIWFARGGYGACRIADAAIAQMNRHAQNKIFLGYSDAGYLLCGLLAKGIGRPVHGPMTNDVCRNNGEVAAERSLEWIMANAPGSPLYAPPTLAHTPKQIACNMIVFSQLLGTSLQPDMTDRILMLEEVDEPLYRIDRALHHITSNPNVRSAKGLMLGRCAPITPNDPPFSMDEETLAKHWCAVSDIPYLGRADIGHDADNKVVPFF